MLCALRDLRISIEARGAIGFLVACQREQFNLDDLSRELEISRDRMRRIIGGLIAAGYVVRQSERDAGGAFSGIAYRLADTLREPIA